MENYDDEKLITSENIELMAKEYQNNVDKKVELCQTQLFNCKDIYSQSIQILDYLLKNTKKNIVVNEKLNNIKNILTQDFNSINLEYEQSFESLPYVGSVIDAVNQLAHCMIDLIEVYLFNEKYKVYIQNAIIVLKELIYMN